MKAFIKIIVVFLGILLIAYASLWIYVDLNGSRLAEEALHKALGVQVSVERVSFRPWWGIEVKGVKGKSIYLGHLAVKASLIRSLGGRLYLNKVEIEELKLKVKKKNGKFWGPKAGRGRISLSVPHPFSSVINTAFAAPSENFPLPLPVFVQKLYISRASLVFTDEDARTVFSLPHIELKAANLGSGLKSKTRFSFTADWDEGDAGKSGRITAEGDVFFPRHIVKVQVKASHIDYFSIANYLPASWRPQNIGLKEAFFSLQADFKNEGRFLVIVFSAFIDECKFKELENPPASYYMLKSIISIFKRHSSKPLVRFAVKVPFDNISTSAVLGRIKTRLKQLGFGIFSSGRIDADEGGKEGISDILKDAEELWGAVKEIKGESKKASGD